ncbi:DUF4198 domain-containing protein [Phenylobacterium immobile]|uniref:DUF4198 domain-containing protein n=1 Tax=Phenylobacterium immobile TaxID=21 RepID=UPI000A4C9DB2|nr:DUF4198 domain-containing protein [Phenylobacterium immobile]
MQTLRTILAAGAALGLASAASAHMPYVLPSHFAVAAGEKPTTVTVQASFTEEPFQPDVVMKSDLFSVRGPDGQDTAIATPTYLRELAVMEAPITSEGTYRVTSGARLGRTAKMYKSAAGPWLFVGEESEVKPDPATVVDAQSVTTAEAYLTRGKPSTAALEAKGAGLELKPLTHPSDIAAGSPARFLLLIDGKPLPGQIVRLYRGHGLYDGKKVAGEATTGADGVFSFNAPDPGLYMTIVRYRAAAPPGAATPYRSYTHTLSFEAAE